MNYQLSVLLRDKKPYSKRKFKGQEGQDYCDRILEGMEDALTRTENLIKKNAHLNMSQQSTEQYKTVLPESKAIVKRLSDLIYEEDMPFSMYDLKYARISLTKDPKKPKMDHKRIIPEPEVFNVFIQNINTIIGQTEKSSPKKSLKPDF